MTFLSDSFTEASTVDLNAHTPETGGAWSRLAGFTTRAINVAGGAGYAEGANADTALYINAATPPSADYEVEASFTSLAAGAGAVGLMARCANDAFTCYQLFYSDTNGRWDLEAVVGGSGVQLGSFTDGFSSGSRTVNLSCVGTAIKAFIDGAEVISATDSGITAAGFAGVRGRLNGRINSLTAIQIGGSAAVTVADPLKNNTGTVLANQTGVAASVLNATTLASVHEATGLTTDASGVLDSISSAAITATNNYHVAVKLSDGSIGITGPITAS